MADQVFWPRSAMWPPWPATPSPSSLTKPGCAKWGGWRGGKPRRVSAPTRSFPSTNNFMNGCSNSRHSGRRWAFFVLQDRQFHHHQRALAVAALHDDLAFVAEEDVEPFGHVHHANAAPRAGLR